MDRSVYLALSCLTFYLLWRLTRRTSDRKLPPGPKGLPLIGNLFQLSNDVWLRFSEWKQTYGPIIHLNIAGQSVIVVNSHEVATDLFDRRHQIYSDRPRNIVASEIMSGGIMIVFTPYGDLWRRMRRAAHEGLGKRAVATMNTIQTREALRLANDMLSDPAHWDEHCVRATASVVLSSVYGQPSLDSHDDPMVHKITNFVGRRVRAAYPGAHLVEIFPWMMAFPSWLAKWKRDAESWFKIDSKMFRDLYMNASTVKVDGQEEHTFSTLLAENQERLTLNNDEASWLSGVFCAAGTETTAAVLAFFIQAMVCYPAVQARAQVEIDQVCTPSNPPTFEDAERLPYIRAIVKEILRWKAVDPVGLPRRATEDDVYDGYFIPKGSIIIANVWGMNRDPDVYGPDAAEFRPERHLTEDGKVVRIPHTKEEGHVTYGFGRRICAGVGVANDSLFIDIATILWACRIGPGKGADGKPVYVDPAGILNTGLELRPPPFPCSITPRFPSAAAVLAEKMDRF